MNKLTMRLKLIPSMKSIEVSFDERLSFKENMAMLKSVMPEIKKDSKLYDQTKGIFLDPDKPLKEYQLKGLRCFTVFEIN